MKKVLTLLCSLAILLTACGKAPSVVYDEQPLDGYTTVDRVSQIRFDLPDEVKGKQIDLASISDESTAEQLRSLADSQYLTRYENYGVIMTGPDLFLMAARDGALFETDLSTVQYQDMVQYILQDEIEYGDTIKATSGAMDTYTDEETGVTKLICPIVLTNYTFANLEYEGEYAGYVALAQEKDGVSALCIAVSPVKEEEAENKALNKRNLNIVRSFRLNTGNESSYYTTYSNVLSGFSYDSGGLFSYDGYAYQNLGTEKLDTTGTYNRLSDRLGMYCLDTSFGPLNLPYILDDGNLSSTVIDNESTLSANITSSADDITFDVSVSSWDGKDYDDVLYEFRSQIQEEKQALSNEYGYTRQAVLSEEIMENTGAITTVCGFNDDSLTNTTVYYKLDCAKYLYSLTRIEATKSVTDDIPPLLQEIVDLSGITLS